MQRLLLMNKCSESVVSKTQGSIGRPCYASRWRMDIIAAIAQLAARRSHNPKVVSSILTRRISYHGTISWDTNTIIGRPQHIHIREDFGRSLKIRDCGASGPRKYGCKSLSCLLPVINPSIRRNSGINTRSRYLW